MFLRVKKVGRQSYLQIVRNHREGKSVRQQVIATLGQRCGKAGIIRSRRHGNE
jgi:hypothetical protein